MIGTVPVNVQIIMVAGNHEYYHNDINSVKSYLRGLETTHKNFKWLDNESFHYKGVDFFGGMMCTDFCLYRTDMKEKSMDVADRYINDFRVSRKSNEGLWNVYDHIREHTAFCNAIEKWAILPAERRVVISHFVPSFKLIHPRWAGDECNPYFTTHMDKYMKDIDLWMFGHTHDSHDIMIGKTRAVCNPKGYDVENVMNFNPNLIIEV